MSLGNNIGNFSPAAWFFLAFILNVLLAALTPSLGNLLYGVALILGVIAFGLWLDGSFNTRNESQTERSQWEQEHHGHRLDRREFWRLLKLAYSNWIANPAVGRSLEDLVAGAAFPNKLPLSDGSAFPDWAWQAPDKWSGDARHLSQFAEQVYIPVKPPRAVRSQIMGGGTDFDRFDSIRRELSQFWDHWGRQAPLEEVIRLQGADDLVKANASEIKLLAFLEIARVKWADTNTPGKGGLFILGRRNAETG